MTAETSTERRLQALEEAMREAARLAAGFAATLPADGDDRASLPAIYLHATLQELENLLKEENGTSPQDRFFAVVALADRLSCMLSDAALMLEQQMENAEPAGPGLA